MLGTYYWNCPAPGSRDWVVARTVAKKADSDQIWLFNRSSYTDRSDTERLLMVRMPNGELEQIVRDGDSVLGGAFRLGKRWMINTEYGNQRYASPDEAIEAASEEYAETWQKIKR